MKNIKRLYFDRAEGISQGNDINKTSASKECDIYHYLYFLDKGFKFQPYVCNSYHDLLMMFMNLSKIAILSIKDGDYHCIISRISKSDVIKLLQNIDLTEKSGVLKIKKIIKIF